jgi:hypothetical protein
MADEKTPQQQMELEALVTKTNLALQKQVEFQAKMTRLKGEELSSAQELVNVEDAKARQAQEFLDLTNQQYNSVEEIKRSRTSILKSMEEERARGQMTLENYNTQVQTLNSIFNLKEQQLGKDEESAKKAKELLGILSKQLLEEQKISQEKIKGIDSGNKIFSNAVGLLGITNKQQSATARFVKSIGDGTEGIKGMAKGLESSVSELFSFSNLAASAVEDIILMTVETDKLTSSFAAIAGGGRDVSTMLLDSQQNLQEMGISMSEVGSAFNALQQDFVDFTTLSDAQKTSVGELTAKMQKLGVSGTTTADNFKFLTATIGKGVGEAEKDIEGFITTADALGIPFNDYNTAFQQLQPRLALFGKKGSEIFRQTAMEAKRLGLDIGEMGATLFSIADGFDEFDEAAGKIASLNLTLGGSFVNTFDVVMAAAEGPFAQVQELQKGFAAAGKSFNELSFREQQFLAKQFGIEVQSLGAVFDGTISSQEEFNKETRTIDDIIQDAVPAIDKLMAGLQGLVTVVEPVISGLASGIQFLGNNIKFLGPLILTLAGVAFALWIKAKIKAKKAANELVEATLQIAAATKEAAVSSAAAAAGISAMAEAASSYPGGPTEEQASAIGDIGEAAEAAAPELENLSEVLSDNTDITSTNLSTVDKLKGGIGALSVVVSSLAAGFGAASQAIEMGSGFLTKYMGMSEKAAKITTSLVIGLGGAIAAYFLLGAAKTAAAAGPFAPAALAAYALAATAVGVAIAGAYGTYEGATMGGSSASSGMDFSAAADNQGFSIAEPVNDAVIQNDGQNTKITPINRQDQLIAAKPGGPVAGVMGAMGGGQVPERLIVALEKVAEVLARPSNKDINVTVELDKRKMGQAVVAVVDRKLAIT